MPSEVGEHDHCQTCYDRSCDGRRGQCEVVACEQDCGARFHRCKRSEHGLLCANAKVECLNAGYGCSAVLHRWQMGRHLAVCPASLVHCTMEWNRWPVCSSERQSHQPVPVLTETRRGQLDTALALRDQRMLTRSLRASARTRRILTTGLSRRHPAVPLSGQLTDPGGASAEDFDGRRELERLMEDMHRWENGPDQRRARSPAGLQQSICDQLYRDKQQSTAGQSAADRPIPPPPPPPPVPPPDDDDDDDVRKPDFSLGSTLYPYIHCVHCERRKERLERLMESHNAMRESNGHHAHESSADLAIDDTGIASNTGAASNTDLASVSGLAGDIGLASGTGITCITGLASDTLQSGIDDDACMRIIKQTLADDSSPKTQARNGADASTVTGESDGVPTKRCSNVSTSSSNSEGSLVDLPPPALFVTPSTTSEVSSAPARGHSKILVVEPPQMTPGSGVASFPGKSLDSSTPASLSLDLSLESITRYQAKPDSMYTFLCAQVFRRDEYASHFQNVHCDIHGGLNGWLEQRCPLAPYGCTYAQRRFYPGQRSARIVHNEQLESFGVRPDGAGCPKDEDEVNAPNVPIQMEWIQVGLSKDASEQTTSVSDTTVSNSNPKHPDSKLTIENGHPQSEPNISNETSEDAALDKKRVADGTQLNTENAGPKEQRPLEGSTNSPSARCRRGGSASEGAVAERAGPDLLSQLPSEILRYMTGFLDGFSMCNLALTSKLLRQVCCSVLEEKGMVLLQWERRNNGWEVAYKVWQFSTAFTPVRHWGFESHPSLAVHLAQCPYNVRHEQTKPFRVMP